MGVILDNTLSWKPQINQVAKRVNCALLGLSLIKTCTKQALRIRLIQSLVSLVFFYLNYYRVVYPDAFLGLKARLQQFSNAAIRYIFGIRDMTRISPFQSKLGRWRVHSRMHYFALLTMNTVVRIKENQLLAKLFKNYVPKQPTCGVRTDLEISNAKKRVFFSSVWWIYSFGTLFP